MESFRKILILAASAVLLCSCGAYKRQAILQDMTPDVEYDSAKAPDARIAIGDQLRIIVTASEPLLASPFNMISGTSTYNTISREEGIKVESEEKKGYIVDNRGEINFPVLGKIRVESLTLEELRLKIESQIRSTGQISEPIVIAEFLNFQFTVLGEVGKVGNYTVSNGVINIFEALAMAGDITMDGQRDKVWVIRTADGKRKVFELNMKSRSCYNSPAFYLQQNDMIYVKPRNGKMDAPMSNAFTITTTVASLVGVLSNIALWSALYLKK